MRAVFFDLDDTLLVTTGTQGERAHLVAECLVQTHRGLVYEDLVSRLLTKDPATGWVRGVDPLLSEFGLTGLAEEARGLWFFQGCSDLVRSYEGALEAITELARDHVLGVITNGRDAIQRSKFAQLPFAHAFKVMVASERAGHEKPRPEIFMFALREAGVAADEAVFVGDRLDVDITGAQSAGLRAVWLDHDGIGVRTGDPEPDAVIHTFNQLLDALARLW